MWGRWPSCSSNMAPRPSVAEPDQDIGQADHDQGGERRHHEDGLEPAGLEEAVGSAAALELGGLAEESGEREDEAEREHEDAEGPRARGYVLHVDGQARQDASHEKKGGEDPSLG